MQMTCCMPGLSFRKEATQNDHLTDASNEDNDGLSDGPVLHSLIYILGKRSALSLSQFVMGLVVGDDFQRLVKTEGRRLHLQKQFMC